MPTEYRERRKVWLIGARRGATDWVRASARESRLPRGDGIAREISHAYRVAGLTPPDPLVAPLRAPHHTADTVSLTGSLTEHRWRPGELALAHGGVLYLEDATELKLQAISMIESAWRFGCLKLYGSIPKAFAGEGLDRAEGQRLVVPTWFDLVVHTLPCPCGNRGQPSAPCPCSDRQIERFFESTRPLTDGAEVVRL